MSALTQRLEDAQYTYADYLTWEDDDHRWELIDGVPYMMAQPSIPHQIISGKLYRQLDAYLDGKSCIVIPAPDVRLFPAADRSDTTVLSPDLVVVCDRSKLRRWACHGAPDLAIEILSLSTSYWDRGIKRRLYLEAGVWEYWLVNPRNKTVEVNILSQGTYQGEIYDTSEPVPVTILPGCVIDMPAVWVDADVAVADNDEEEE
ncbi:MAG: Uma2 family endonuclease [Treponema sp.]|nr:Uma2 family endonuclease [Treponema sp.]